MSSIFRVVLRSWRLALPLFTLAIGLACGGLAWLPTLPAMFLLGRSYGGRPEPRHSGGNTEYGVGAALAGFTPASRR